jgi:hypothetical protein
MVEGRHLTIEWLKMFLLGHGVLTNAERSHLVGCSHCMKLLAQASLEIVRAERGEDGDAA